VSAVEALFALALLASLSTFAVPLGTTAADEFRTAMAARYVASRIMEARMRAVSGSADVALRFAPAGDDYVYTLYADGNGNGVRNAEIASGVDRPIGAPEQLGQHFRDAKFGLAPDVPDADGARGNPDGVRIGSARILTTSPDGTATSGTLYVQGRRGQYAVRILGATARTRLLRYDPGAGQWKTQ
jgi:hypothetical protein